MAGRADPIVILGAGPTGLGCARRLEELGEREWLLFDAEAEAGGLAASVLDPRGFTWDMGGHVQFSHYPFFDDLMDELLSPAGWLWHERESWVWIRGRFVPYPFQLNVGRLPREELLECLRGLVAAAKSPPARPPANFDEWMEASFGPGICRVFMRPYNAKVWAYPARELAAGWIGDRVAAVDLARVIENVVLGRDDVSWGPNNRFRFPRRGGTGAVWRALSARLPAERQRFRRRAVAVSTARHEVRFEDGEAVRYRALVSTIPLDRLVAMSDLRDLAPVAAGLMHSSTHVVGVGLRGEPPEALRTKCWMYFPEDDCPFYRVTVFSNYAPENVPGPGFWSLMAEVAESPARPVDAARVAEDALAGMLRTGLVRAREDVASLYHRRLDYGYPTPSLGRDAILARVQPELEARDVYSRGRFGAWLYEVSNQDHSCAQGREVAERIVSGACERTIRDPAAVNARRGR
jgi:protoporphyrinogen oxidase